MRVVVTGIGLVTPLGDAFWECVSQGVVKGFKINGYKEGPDRFIDLALDAAQKAILDSKLSPQILYTAGVTVSSSKGNIVYRQITNMPNVIGEKLGCFGPTINTISACATGLNSIIMGANIIKTGRAKVVIAGAADSCLTDFVISGFSRLGVLAKDGVCRPYSRNRSGFVLSEGAGVVVLEELEHARARNAGIYGEITGYASLSDAYHETSPNPSGETIIKAIDVCLKKSGTNRDEIDYINTHGTGTKENDFVETKALKKVFGKKAYDIPINSTKAVTGHMLGASSAVEFVVGLLAIKNGFIPPTANIGEPDPLCDLDYVPRIGRKKRVNKFLTLSYGFGGHIACVEGKKFEQDEHR